MSCLHPLPDAPARTFKVRQPEHDDEECECRLVEFDKWSSDKESILPWVCLDGYNPIDASLVPPKGVRFLACRHHGCRLSWEAPGPGWSSIQSNIKRHVGKHFLLKLRKKVDDDLEFESANTRDKSKVSQYEFSAQWLASGLPHYQVTRKSPSGLHYF